MKDYPSVTQILSLYTDYSRVPPDALEAASERGKKVHRICAALALGLWVPIIPEDCQGYVESFKLWFPVVEELIAVEPELVCHDYKFKGHPDLICRIKGDKGFSVPDYKTPRPHSQRWRLQLAAYHRLALVEYGQEFGEAIRVFSLRLSPEGKRPILVEYSGTAAADFNVFLAAKTVYQFFKG